jgi:hypothetical protein
MYVYYCTRFSQQEVGKFIYTHTVLYRQVHHQNH